MARLDSGIERIPMTILVGGTFEGGFDLTDDSGNPILGVTNGWEGRLEVRDDFGGGLIATFATTGGDGTLTIDDNGHCLLSLPSAFTETIATNVVGGGQVRTAVADVEVWQSATPAVRYKPPVLFRVYIRPEVTTG